MVIVFSMSVFFNSLFSAVVDIAKEVNSLITSSFTHTNVTFHGCSHIEQICHQVPECSPSCESNRGSSIEFTYIFFPLSEAALGVCEVGGGFRDERFKDPSAGEDQVALHDESRHQDDERVQDIGREDDGG
jgi:hypothetical protein